MITEKSPVLKDEDAFKQWYQSSGGMPVGSDTTGDPTHYPCIAVVVSGEIPTPDGMNTEFVQYMDYVYFDDFKFGPTGVLKV